MKIIDKAVLMLAVIALSGCGASSQTSVSNDGKNTEGSPAAQEEQQSTEADHGHSHTH